MTIKLLLSDGSAKEIPPQDLKKELESVNAIAVRVNGELRDLYPVIIGEVDTSAVIEPVVAASAEGLGIYRHSVSHIMAHAVQDLFPEVKVAIGPSIEDGFYYDFDRETPFSVEDLEKIEKKMTEIIKKSSPFVRKIMDRREAIEFFRGKGEEYKVEILNEIADDEVSFYEEDGFTDLCRGPHLPRTGRVKAFKLLSVAGAYWRGDEKRKMLQRIYGTAFVTKDELKTYLEFLEEVKRRDHRKLGKELDLFSMNDEIGSGLILWHPNGALIRKTIEDFWREEHIKADYNLLFTPHIARLDLWKTSGHVDFYSENMYSPMDIDGVEYELKPMNCPFHILIYKNDLKSYRDLPIRYAELGTVYRYERSGVLHGLLRVRGFTQDDAHIFCREDQIEAEIRKVLEFTIFMLETFGFREYSIYLSTRPEKYVGTVESWERATAALRMALDNKGLKFSEDVGGGAFYGPKIDIKIKDALNRYWQCSTIQVDFNNPERFDMTYRGSDGAEHRPIMIHRALMGSLERFFGVLLEHYGGAFPLWLAPVQAKVLTISDRHDVFAKEVCDRMKAAGLRPQADMRNEKIGFKIREATIRKIPYLVIIGDKEAANRQITVRLRNGDNKGPYGVDEFIEIMRQEVLNKQ
jgi:threonyl-tRNA synthetase